MWCPHICLSLNGHLLDKSGWVTPVKSQGKALKNVTGHYTKMAKRPCFWKFLKLNSKCRNEKLKFFHVSGKFYHVAWMNKHKKAKFLNYQANHSWKWAFYQWHCCLGSPLHGINWTNLALGKRFTALMNDRENEFHHTETV